MPSLVWAISSKSTLFKVYAASLLRPRVHRKLPRLRAQVPPQIILKTLIRNILEMIWKYVSERQIFSLIEEFCHLRYSIVWYMLYICYNFQKRSWSKILPSQVCGTSGTIFQIFSLIFKTKVFKHVVRGRSRGPCQFRVTKVATAWEVII